MGQMSESGKVSLPTPERIEEIKQGIERAKAGGYDGGVISVADLESLLAALEESEQQNNVWQVEANQWLNDLVEKTIELAEAQQTIARQQERERSIIYEVSEIHKEAAAGNSGSLERADTALNRIILLSSNLLALGNKEGSDKA
jgi:limonene-1,2-epoxide hydrolase